MGFDVDGKSEDVTGTPLRILVVDDDELNQRMMRVLLTRDRHQVHIASNGADAVAMVKSQKYDIVLMDLQMPVMDGVEASRKIREWENGGRHTYIVALTASYLPEKGQELFEAGIDNYISKPFDVGHLRQMLRYGLDHRKLRNTSELILEAADGASAYQDLDYQKGIKQVGGDEGIYKELLADFIHELPEKLKNLQNCLLARDMEGLSRAAHNLKGVSSSLGVLQLSEYARTLEKQADEGYTKAPESIITEINDISGKFIQKANNFLAGTALETKFS